MYSTQFIFPTSLKFTWPIEHLCSSEFQILLEYSFEYTNIKNISIPEFAWNANS